VPAAGSVASGRDDIARSGWQRPGASSTTGATTGSIAGRRFAIGAAGCRSGQRFFSVPWAGYIDWRWVKSDMASVLVSAVGKGLLEPAMQRLSLGSGVIHGHQ